MRKVNQKYLLKQIDNFEQDIGSVLDLLNGDITLEECWDTTDLSNWKSILTFLKDTRYYLETVEEEPGYSLYEDEDISDEEQQTIDYMIDDIPPEDDAEEEVEHELRKNGNKRKTK